MAKSRTLQQCAVCGATSQRWVGRCPTCGQWNTMEAVAIGAPGPNGHRVTGPVTGRAVSLASVDPDGCAPHPTGIAEVDRVLGGGLLIGSVTLVYGEPGVGKSTLLLQVLVESAAQGRRVLLVSAEESAAQVRSRAARLGPLADSLMISAGSDLDRAESEIASLAPDLVVVDSIQTVFDPDVSGPPGSLSQIRACTDRLTTLAKSRDIAVVVVGHVTKEGDLAGPRALEHLVDTVLSFEGDRHHALRLLRAVKHRFGPTGEVGVFEMGEEGLNSVSDPGPLLLGDRLTDMAGSAVTPLLQGRRPLLVEIQALVCRTTGVGPRRSAQGVDGRRLAFLLAVLACRCDTDLGANEVFVSAAGGISTTEPASDLSLCLAVASAALDRPLPATTVAFGEVGLAGEVRGVPGHNPRLAESSRLGFVRAIVPWSTPDGPDEIELLRVRTVCDALAVAFPSENVRDPEIASSRRASSDSGQQTGLELASAGTIGRW